jgi:heme/copper-type cytochrome/quinol oxidase subunit 3
MSKRPGVEVGHLPVTAFGSRDPLWWGVVALICVESMMFALLWVTYFFMRGNESQWPPTSLSNHTTTPCASPSSTWRCCCSAA